MEGEVATKAQQGDAAGPAGKALMAELVSGLPQAAQQTVVLAAAVVGEAIGLW